MILMSLKLLVYEALSYLLAALFERHLEVVVADDLDELLAQALYDHTLRNAPHHLLMRP